MRKLALAVAVLLLIGLLIAFVKVGPARSFVDVSVVGYGRVEGQSVARVKVSNPTSRTLAVMVDGALKNTVAIALYEQEINGSKTNWSNATRKAASPLFVQPNSSVSVNVIIATNGPSKVWIDVSEVLSSPGTKAKDRLLLLMIKRNLIEPVRKVLLPELDWNWSENRPQAH